MRRKTGFAVLVLVTLLAMVGCRRQEDTTPSAEDEMEPKSVTITLAQKNNSGQSGTATLTGTANNQTEVVVELTNSPGGPQPIHIHEGTCANLNPAPKYSLTSMQNGKSQTTVPIPLDDLLAGSFSINVHKSPEEASVYVSCGEIKASSGAGGM